MMYSNGRQISSWLKAPVSGSCSRASQGLSKCLAIVRSISSLVCSSFSVRYPGNFKRTLKHPQDFPSGDQGGVSIDVTGGKFQKVHIGAGRVDVCTHRRLFRA
jgi:hypothetical protein